jgi:hypothetical protein
MLVVVLGCGDDETTTVATTTTSTGATGGQGGGGAEGGGGGQGGQGGDGGQITPTPCAGASCDLTFRGSRFTGLDGQDMHFGLVVQGQMDFDYESATPIASGSFEADAPGVLDKNVLYFLNFYVDLDQNGSCEQTPTDLVGRIPLGPIQDNLEVTITPESNPSNLGCAGFP